MSGVRKSFQCGKKRHAITMETKVDIIKRHKKGEKCVDIARVYQMNESTIRTFIKDKERIIQHVKSAAPMQSTIISKRRGHLIEEMENLLQTWIKDSRQQRIPISLMLIQEKALSLRT